MKAWRRSPVPRFGRDPARFPRWMPWPVDITINFAARYSGAPLTR